MWSRCDIVKSRVRNIVGDSNGDARTHGVLQAVRAPQLERRNYWILLSVPCMRTHALLIRRKSGTTEGRCKANRLARHDVDQSAVLTRATAPPQRLGDPRVDVAHARLSEAIVSWRKLIVVWVQTCYLYHRKYSTIGNVTLNVEP